MSKKRSGRIDRTLAQQPLQAIQRGVSVRRRAAPVPVAAPAVRDLSVLPSITDRRYWITPDHRPLELAASDWRELVRFFGNPGFIRSGPRDSLMFSLPNSTVVWTYRDYQRAIEIRELRSCDVDEFQARSVAERERERVIRRPASLEPRPLQSGRNSLQVTSARGDVIFSVNEAVVEPQRNERAVGNSVSVNLMDLTQGYPRAVEEIFLDRGGAVRNAITAARIADGAVTTQMLLARPPAADQVTSVEFGNELPSRRITDCLLWQGNLYRWSTGAARYVRAVPIDSETGPVSPNTQNDSTQEIYPDDSLIERIPGEPSFAIGYVRTRFTLMFEENGRWTYPRGSVWSWALPLITGGPEIVRAAVRDIAARMFGCMRSDPRRTAPGPYQGFSEVLQATETDVADALYALYQKVHAPTRPKKWYTRLKEWFLRYAAPK